MKAAATCLTIVVAAAGAYWYTAVNVGLVEGKPKQLQLRGLLRPGIDAKAAFGSLLMERLRENPKAAFVKDGTVTEASPLTPRNWLLTPTAIAFIVPQYEAGPWSEGGPWSECLTRSSRESWT